MSHPDPVLPIILDVQHPANEFALRIPAGTSPIIAATLLDGGAPFDPSGWTARLVHFEAWDSTEFVEISHAGDFFGNTIFFPCDPTKTSLVAERPTQLLLTKDGGEIEFGRGLIDFVQSVATLSNLDVTSASPRGALALEANDTQADITFADPAWPTAPAAVLVTIEAPGDWSGVVFASVTNVTGGGFRAVFSAAIPDEGYKLNWAVIR